MINFAEFGWPQWTILVLILLRLLIYGAKHGQSLTVKIKINNCLFNTAILLTILYCGGFFS